MVKKKIKSGSLEAKNCLDKIDILRKNGPRIEKDRHSDILFVTGCTSDKDGDCGDDEMPAFKRYIGEASSGMLKFFGVFHQKRKRPIDLYVLSAGYGFIPAEASIQKYDVSFNNVDSILRKEMTKKLEIGKDFQSLLKLGYKLVVLRLGSNYIMALKDASPKGYDVLKGVKVCCLKPKTGKTYKKLLRTNNLIEVPVYDSDIRENRGKNACQDQIWSKFFEIQKNDSLDGIINKISNARNVRELLK